MKKGFTLVELLVGMGLFAMVAVTASGFLFYSLRGARKAAAVGSAKAEGAYALNAMVQALKFAKEITLPCAANSVGFVRGNGDTVTYQLTGVAIASSGAYLLPSGAFQSVPNSTLTSNRVNVAACAGSGFTCVDSRTVDICFTVQDVGGNTDVTTRAEAGAGIQFKTRVTVRNFDK